MAPEVTVALLSCSTNLLREGAGDVKFFGVLAPRAISTSVCFVIPRLSRRHGIISRGGRASVRGYAGEHRRYSESVFPRKV